MFKVVRRKKISYLHRNKGKNYVWHFFRNMEEISEIFMVLKEEKNHQSRILYPVKLSFQTEGDMKTFLDKYRLREFISSRLPCKKY